MGILFVPFHVGERVAGLTAPAGAETLEPDLPAGTPVERMIVLFRRLAERVAGGKISIVYAGDCMAPLGVLAGLQRIGPSPSIVWLDAHGDFNTWETTPSGYIGGMPLAMLVGRGDQAIVEALGLETVEPGRIVIADARDLDPEEGVALAASGVRTTTVERACDALPQDGSPLYVHLDVDVVTPAEMPALRFPAGGGPSLSRVDEALKTLHATGRIACITVACTWDTSVADAGRAAEATQRLVASLTGGSPPA